VVLLRIGAVEGIENTRTIMTFRTVKETSAVTLDAAS